MLLLEAILLINMMSEDYTLFSQHIAHDSYNVREDALKGFVPRLFYKKYGFEPDELVIEFEYPHQRFVLHRN